MIFIKKITDETKAKNKTKTKKIVSKEKKKRDINIRLFDMQRQKIFDLLLVSRKEKSQKRHTKFAIP